MIASLKAVGSGVDRWPTSHRFANGSRKPSSWPGASRPIADAGAGSRRSEYEEFLETRAIPAFRSVAIVLKSEGLMWEVMTPSGEVRLVPGRRRDESIALSVRRHRRSAAADGQHDARPRRPRAPSERPVKPGTPARRRHQRGRCGGDARSRNCAPGWGDQLQPSSALRSDARGPQTESTSRAAIRRLAQASRTSTTPDARRPPACRRSAQAGGRCPLRAGRQGAEIPSTSSLVTAAVLVSSSRAAICPPDALRSSSCATAPRKPAP